LDNWAISLFIILNFINNLNKQEFSGGWEESHIDFRDKLMGS